jgi:Trk K+ transport system NAD-binding subunit
MRKVTTTDIVKDGQLYKLSLIESPNIDDVITSEAQVQAYMIATASVDDTRRVDRTLREILMRFGVEQ